MELRTKNLSCHMEPSFYERLKKYINKTDMTDSDYVLKLLTIHLNELELYESLID